MKLVLRTLWFHLLCIIIFSFIYYNNKEDFEFGNNRSYVDYFLYSTTVQAGIGSSNLYPVKYRSKIFLIIQQLLLISTHVITLYILTL